MLQLKGSLVFVFIVSEFLSLTEDTELVPEVKQLGKQAFCQFIFEIRPICLINNQIVVKHEYEYVFNKRRSLLRQ